MPSLLTRGLTIAALLILMGAGCRSGSSSRESRPTPTTGGSVLDSIGRGSCDHPYFPVRQGYSVTFKNSYNSLVDGSPQVDRYTMRITEADAARAKMEVQFSSGLRSTQDISCADGILRTNAYLDMSGGRSVTARTISSSGEYLPRDLQVGSAWSQTFNLEMRPTSRAAAEAMPVMNARATLNHQAIREESITVPSGTYTAIVVKTKTSMQLDIAGAPAAAAGAPAMEFESLGWWVRGVGLVKSQAQLAGGFSATSEAETVVIP